MKKVFTTSILYNCSAEALELMHKTPSQQRCSRCIGTTRPMHLRCWKLKSYNEGILISRMTLTQRNAIVSPATDDVSMQTNSTPGFYYIYGSAGKRLLLQEYNKSLSNLTAPTAVNCRFVSAADNNKSLGS
jgi:hypothetical protein